MTGGLKFAVSIGTSPNHCATCGSAMYGKRSHAQTCSDLCRKIKNGQTNRPHRRPQLTIVRTDPTRLGSNDVDYVFSYGSLS